ncbi:MAG: hypothetical protein WD673_14035 [Alphaproteobacteria bacterium]
MTTFVDNWINVQPGSPGFLVASNVCDYFELGAKSGGDHWLEGKIVEPNEFIFNGRIFLPNRAGSGTIIDNFPKGPIPQGWALEPLVDREGYRLVMGDLTLFGYEVSNNHFCHVTVNIYAADGVIVAESLPGKFSIHRGPARIGRNAIVIG